jgi:hypothetical protein
MEPVSCWARGAAFWLESEARVQIAPSGIMKKRKVGFSIAVVPVWRLVNERFNRRFFPVDVVNCFIGFVASISCATTASRSRGQNHV